MAQQECLKLLARLQPHAHCILARSPQVAHRLVRIVRDPDGLGLAGARQLRRKVLKLVVALQLGPILFR
jgi:hypothetical protein